MDSIRFTLDGKVYTLTRERVTKAVAGHVPQPIQKLAVQVGDDWYPVKQAFGLAMGMHNNRFNSTRAYDLLGRLGFARHSTELDGPVPAQVGDGGDTGVVSSFDRVTALGLAVQLHAGRDVPAATVLSTANAFGAWLEGGDE